MDALIAAVAATAAISSERKSLAAEIEGLRHSSTDEAPEAEQADGASKGGPTARSDRIPEGRWGHSWVLVLIHLF